MKPLRRVLLIFAGLIVSCPLFGQQKQIIGYYPSWKVKRGGASLTPDKIRYKKFTMLNFAFLYPRSDGSIAGKDSLAEVDDWILGGDRSHETGKRVAGTSLAERAHAHGVKALVSIGGWEGSRDFPGIAGNPVKRQHFAGDCVRVIQEYHLDGVDIDWEYPGYTPHNGTRADKGNFTALLRVIRDSLDALGKTTNKHLLLTAAVPAGSPHADGIDIQKVARLLDYVNVMTYDFANPWSALSGHNSPLYGSQGSLDASLRFYKQQGAKAKKITLGIPFYGYAYKNCGKLGSKHEGPDLQYFQGGEVFFNLLTAVRGQYTRSWDDSAKVPYLVIPPNTLVSYDDEESIRLKAEYVRHSDAAGLIIWEITGDFLPDSSTPLLDIINTSIGKR